MHIGGKFTNLEVQEAILTSTQYISLSMTKGQMYVSNHWELDSIDYIDVVQMY